MTADMKLALVLDHTRVSLRAVVSAARETFDSLSMKHYRTSPAARLHLTPPSPHPHPHSPLGTPLASQPLQISRLLVPAFARTVRLAQCGGRAHLGWGSVPGDGLGLQGCRRRRTWSVP
jgi:hypothetical protein